MWMDRAAEQLSGGTVIVTGASSGIGRAFVEAVARPGMRLALVARRADRLEQLAERIEHVGAEAFVQPVDLRDPAMARATAEAVLARWGAPSLVVANAGHSIARGVLECTDRPDTVERLVAINHTGAIAHLLPVIAAMAAAGNGHVVGVTTANARIATPGWGAYAASKAAFDAWLSAARPELAEKGVTVSSIAFPLVATELVDPRRRSRGMPAGEAAEWIAKAVVTRQARVAPWWLRPAEVAHALAPATVATLIGRRSRG